MRMYLIYATKPELVALALIKDPSDAQGLIEQKLNVNKDRAKAAAEKAEKDGGATPTLGIQKWESARVTPVEVDLT